MALNESVLEEFGLAPRWVRRGMAAAQEAAGTLSVEQGGAPGTSAAGLPPERLQNGEPAGRALPQPAVDDSDARTALSSFTPEPQRASSPAVASRAPHVAEPPAMSEPSSFGAPPDDGFAWFDDLPLHPPGEAHAAVPALPAIHTLDWDALSERVANCERCRLCEKRTQAVFGVGDRHADWMLIGEAPGENEDRVGEPFVGQAGKLLDNMLRSLTLARGANVYIANVIKCRPPGNRNPEPDEVARCEPYLQRQVELVKPKLIVALGRFAAQSLLKTDASISSLRGRVHQYEGVPVIVTYHPAYLLRSLPDKAKAWADLCLARDTWREAADEAGREGGAASGAAPR
ncbi:DNA polymerase [Paraburkholderia phenoliruptrix]|uniref:uracil-DNA glycosylase n=1 Tax=Paraburkholderia phenoliruptrix TaxID=252970 RepID=UPI0028678776|nr:uracil-DNA glycosylase family protein [Paraburkholderia phenoliruptrix]MDR6419300.1 DNA polymerase [Paraburkholderia phenoliruptrix]